VAPINYSDLVMVVHPSVPAKSVKELVAIAKANTSESFRSPTGPNSIFGHSLANTTLTCQAFITRTRDQFLGATTC